MIGNHAIFIRRLGTKVVLVDPPYRISQPQVVTPSVLLSVEIKKTLLIFQERVGGLLSRPRGSKRTWMERRHKHSFVPKRIDNMELNSLSEAKSDSLISPMYIYPRERERERERAPEDYCTELEYKWKENETKSELKKKKHL
jgi:hypothetical protein